MSEFNRIYDKLDVVEAQIEEVKGILTAQHAVLVEHSRRSKASEDRIKQVEATLQPIVIRDKLLKLLANGALGAIALMGTIVAIAAGLKHLGII